MTKITDIRPFIKAHKDCMEFIDDEKLIARGKEISDRMASSNFEAVVAYFLSTITDNEEMVDLGLEICDELPARDFHAILAYLLSTLKEKRIRALVKHNLRDMDLWY